MATVWSVAVAAIFLTAIEWTLRGLGQGTDQVQEHVEECTQHLSRRGDGRSGPVAELEPDALVVSVGANEGQLMSSTDAAFAEGPPETSAFRVWLGELHLTSTLSRLLGHPFASDKVRRVPPSEYAANLEAIFAGARASGITVVFAHICCCGADYGRALDQSLAAYEVPRVFAVAEARRAIQEGSIHTRYRATLAKVEGWYRPEELTADSTLLYHFRDDCHLNPLGADIIADQLANRLGELVGE